MNAAKADSVRRQAGQNSVQKSCPQTSKPLDSVDLDRLRSSLEDYLRQKGVNTRKPFRCLSPEHEDRNPSMSYHAKAQNVHCFSCGVTYDLFDLIGLDYNLSTFPEKREKAISLFGCGQRPLESRALRGEKDGAVNLEVGNADRKFGQSAQKKDGAVNLEVGNADRKFGQSAQKIDGAENLESVGCGGQRPLGRTSPEAVKPAAAVRSAVAPSLKPAALSLAVVHSVARGEPSCEYSDRSLELDKLREASDGKLDYFAARGVSPELCERYGLFQSGGRAVMPLFAADGRCLGWCARAVADGVEPRYKNSSGPLPLWTAGAAIPMDSRFPALQNGNDLPGLPPGASPVYITEGILDALTLIAAGRQAVALCGSQNTRKLFASLDENRTAFGALRFCCCGDGDAAGRKMNAALIEGFTARGLACSILELPDGADLNALSLRDADALSHCLAATEAQLPAPLGDQYTTCDENSALGVLDDFFAQAARRAGNPGESTGLLGLDAALGGGLRPGLIVLGAPSSLGKTSLVLQIADNIAHSGTDVLYFSLEMSRYELMAKSLSRISAELDDRNLRRAFTARDLLTGMPCGGLEQELLLKRTKAEYERFAGRVFLREGLADIGPLEIRKAVAEHIARRGGKPVIFVDYLQILAPCDLRSTDKQNTDRAVVELKRVSRDFDVPVIAISSFNRAGYGSAAAMESFKESGAVEYSSDILLALQLAGVGEPGFDANQAKLRDPRQVELVMLKNRSGAPYAKLKLEYHARFGVFWEA